MTRPAQSSVVRNPMPDKDPETLKIYAALLQRRALMLTNENFQLRACLERATGVQWDNTNVADIGPELLDEMVAQDIARGLRMTVEEARELVRQNKVMANPSDEEHPMDSAPTGGVDISVPPSA